MCIRDRPLRERRDDIPLLCKGLLESLTRGIYSELPPEQLAALKGYHWPGNVRELKNILERSVILAAGDELEPAALLETGLSLAGAAAPGEPPKFRPLEEVEREHIERALKFYRGNKTHAAMALGVSLSTLRRRLATFAVMDKRG